jgi:polyisoprenoid-binding protein YceI
MVLPHGVMVALGLFLSDPQAGGEGASTAETYKVDPVHSTVLFRIKHLNLSYVHGRFNDVAGTFSFDDEDPSAGSLDIEVPVAKIDTNNAERDKHLKSPDFFDAERFPLITFKSRSVKKVGEQTYEVGGELALHGVTKPLTVKLERIGSGKDPWGGYRTGFETTFTIKRSDFGMTNVIGPVGDEVRLTVAIEGVRR